MIGAGLFKVDEDVEWGTTIRGQVRRVSGKIYSVVPAGVQPAPPAVSRRGDLAFNGDETRDHESYIVRAVVDGSARFYWPRVSALAPAPARIVTTDHDREALRAAERRALEAMERECDAAKTAIAYRHSSRVTPRIAFAADAITQVTLWADSRHPLGGVVEVVRHPPLGGDADVVAVYFARDHAGPDRLDWLELVGLR